MLSFIKNYSNTDRQVDINSDDQKLNGEAWAVMTDKMIIAGLQSSRAACYIIATMLAQHLIFSVLISLYQIQNIATSPKIKR